MSTTVENLEYVRSLRLGDHEVFAAMVREHRRSLLRHARQRVTDEAAAEDVVQETFIRAYRAAQRLDDDSRIGPWLHAILTNVCIDEANRRKRELDKFERIVGYNPDDHVSPSPELELGLEDDHPELLSALASLPVEHRQALTLRFLDELSYDEVARSTGVSEENARARVSRARTAVRHALNGAAAIPVAIYVFLRRGRRASAAFERAEAVMPRASAVQANRVATVLAPAVDATTLIVTSSPVAAPLLGKAAAGAGMLAFATLSFGSEPAAVQQVAVTAPIVTVAPVIVEVAPTPTTLAPVIVTPSVLAAVETVPPTAPPITVPATTVAPTTVAPTVVVPVQTAPPITTVAPTTVATTTPPAALSLGGTLSMSGSVIATGPRLDVSGGATLNVGQTSSSGSLSGRIGLDGVLDEAGNQRLDGLITLSLASGGSIEIKLAGFATGDGTYSISGRFRASGATGDLITSGSFSGSLGTGSLTLTLA